MCETGRAFIKAEAAGNDLVLVDARGRRLEAPQEFARAACDRRRGVGGDGVLVLDGSERADAFVRMYNPDGTEDFCGNGLRCVAAYLAPAGGAVRMESPKGTHAAQVAARGGGSYEVTVDLVAPGLAPADIPARLEGRDAIGYRLEVDGAAWKASSLSVGTTHTVIFLEEQLPERDFRRYSPKIENHVLFPERTSVLWCVRRGEGDVQMRVWERGAGETLGCGTGTCAVAVAGALLGVTGRRVEVETAGGRMAAEWSGEGPVKLTGPARLVYRGVLARDFGAGKEWTPPGPAR